MNTKTTNIARINKYGIILSIMLVDFIPNLYRFPEASLNSCQKLNFIPKKFNIDSGFKNSNSTIDLAVLM